MQSSQIVTLRQLLRFIDDLRAPGNLTSDSDASGCNVNMIYVNSDDDSDESEQDSMFVNVCPVTRRGSKNNSTSTTPASDSTATSETRVQTRGMKRRNEPSTSQTANLSLE